MTLIWIHLFLCLFLISLSHQKSTMNSSTYIAGVVEFNPNMDTNRGNLDKYLEIIRSIEAADVDILVFPESTLSRMGSYIPEPETLTIPCYDDKYDEIVMELSCAAREKETYIVVNLSEISDCTNESQIALNDTRRCSSSGLNRYNTNVVFDRTGAVVSRYRKFNLFGEFGTNTTLSPDVSSFDSDFGVTFGHFICFDLAFDVPARRLIEMGVKNIIFPTMWFSEAPFLTAVQFQQNWAYTNNVNLLAAGANNPSVGSTGTGIYNGRKGPIISAMHANAETKLYVAEIEKIPSSTSINRIETPKNDPSEMLKLKLKRDQLELSNHKKIDLTKSSINEDLCYYDDVCCSFDISLEIKEELVEGNDDLYSYSYRMIIFDGVRTYDGFATGGTFICGIIACLDPDDIWSCGWRFNETQQVSNSVQFNSIKLFGRFKGGTHIMSLPNGLDTDIMPFYVNDFVFEEGKDYEKNGTLWRDIKYELMVPKSNLLSFGIYGRNFLKDGQSVSDPYKNRSVQYQLNATLALITLIAVCFI